MAPQQSLDAGSIDSISYDEVSETEDEFLQLPVSLRSLDLLKCEEEEMVFTEDQPYTLTFTNKEIHERDLRHAEELQRHAEELEDLYIRFEETNQNHNEKIHSMRSQFNDESRKREAILEQALSYAEKLQAKQNTEQSKYTTEIERLKTELQKRDAKIEELQAKNLEKDKTIRKLTQKAANKPLWRRKWPRQISRQSECYRKTSNQKHREGRHYPRSQPSGLKQAPDENEPENNLFGRGPVEEGGRLVTEQDDKMIQKLNQRLEQGLTV